MVNVAKENLCIHKLVSEKNEIVFIEGDMIVPDSKPDILNTIGTSGMACVYKKELLEGKLKIDGTINTYIMYMPEGMEQEVRGLNTTLDFTENIEIENVTSDMQAELKTNIKSIEAKVINGRKIGIKVALEFDIKIFTTEDEEIVNNILENNDIQTLKTNLTLNSLLGTGTTKIYAKDTVQIDNIDQLAEILKVSTHIIGKDVKISYNKVLTKAEAEIKIMYLTEDNRINQVNPKIPIVGFIDIANVSENNVYDINYELRNVIIKPNSQEEHSIYIEMEFEVSCSIYEEKDINLIEDIYSTDYILKTNKTQISTISDKKSIKQNKVVQEKVMLTEIEGKKLIDVDLSVLMNKETKINTKILYEMELKMKFTFLSQNMELEIKEATIPFEHVIDNLERGESINTTNDIEIQSQDFIIKDGGEIDCNINMNIQTDMNRIANIDIINDVEEEKEREEQDYSIVIYIVKKGDTLWNIAKEFGNTVDNIVRVNGIEDPNQIQEGQKLYIPKNIRKPVSSNV